MYFAYVLIQNWFCHWQSGNNQSLVRIYGKTIVYYDSLFTPVFFSPITKNNSSNDSRILFLAGDSMLDATIFFILFEHLPKIPLLETCYH
jgi:hypothetical protein